MNSAGGVKSSNQTETQREVRAGGPGSPLQRREKGNWIILLAVGVFYLLEPQMRAPPLLQTGGWGFNLALFNQPASHPTPAHLSITNLRAPSTDSMDLHRPGAPKPLPFPELKKTY